MTNADQEAALPIGHHATHEPKGPDPLDGFVPMLRVVKKADEPRASTATTADDAELKLHLDASHIYAFTLWLYYSGSLAGDLKFAFAVPTGATGGYHLAALGLGAAHFVGIAAFTVETILEGFAGPLPVPVNGLITMGDTPGDLVFRWSQNTSSVDASSVLAGAVLFAWPLT